MFARPALKLWETPDAISLQWILAAVTSPDSDDLTVAYGRDGDFAARS